jgi:hypothetical protein
MMVNFPDNSVQAELNKQQQSEKLVNSKRMTLELVETEVVALCLKGASMRQLQQDSSRSPRITTSHIRHLPQHEDTPMKITWKRLWIGRS